MSSWFTDLVRTVGREQAVAIRDALRKGRGGGYLGLTADQQKLRDYLMENYPHYLGLTTAQICQEAGVFPLVEAKYGKLNQANRYGGALATLVKLGYLVPRRDEDFHLEEQ
jgi:hypothetical protein